MIDTSKPLAEGTLRFRLVKWFCDNVNFCHGVKYEECDDSGNPVPKPDNKLYEFFYTYWLWPFKQTGCACCNTVRGLVYGAAAGFILGRLL